jgi:valyl-tRNA synthetase
MPYITEEIFQICYVKYEPEVSLHISRWPEASPQLIDKSAELFGNALVGIATEVRRYKSVNEMPMGTPLACLQISSSNRGLLADLETSTLDIKSVTRALDVEFNDKPLAQASAVSDMESLWVAIEQ